MDNTVMMLQFVGQFMQEGVARMTARHGQVGGQGHLGRAHAPDMQIMDVRHPRQTTEKRLHLIEIDMRRYALERQPHGIPQ